MAEEIIISIELEKGQNEKEVDTLTKKLTELSKANAELSKQNKELIKTGQENSKEYVENTRQIEINKQKISEATATRKGLVQTILAEDDSIKSLKVRNAELIKQRDQLSTSTNAGRAAIANINTEIDKNNKTIKDNVSVLEKQKINIGNYASALDNVVPGLGGFINGIQGATRASLAFIATPIGAILAAIGIVVAAVVTYFKKFEVVLDIIEDAVTKVTAVFDSFIQNLDKIASIVGNVLVGNFAKAAAQTSLLANEFNNAANEAQRLLDATRDLEDAEFKYRIESAAAANQMKAWVIAAKNRNLSVEESNALLQKASDLENEMTDRAVKNAQARADIEEGKLVASKKAQLEAANLLRQTGEDQEAYLNRLVDSGIFSPEQLEPLIAAYERVQQEASAGLAFQEKIANQQAALFDKQEADEKKRRENAAKEREKQIADALKESEDRRKQAEQDRKDISDAEKEQFDSNLAFLKENADRELEVIKEKYLNDLLTKEEFEAEVTRIEMEALEERRNFLAANGEATTEIELQILDRRIKQKEAAAAKEKAINAAEVANERAVTDAKLSLYQQAGQVISQLAGKSKELAIAGIIIQKAAAIGQIIANTSIANAKAVAASPLTFGMPWVAINTISGILSGASVVAEAGTQIAAINSTKAFALGGQVLSGTRINSSHGTPIRRSNGDNLLATVRTGEVILNERQQAALGGASTFRRIGVPGFAGGAATATATQTAINQGGIRDLTQAILSRPVFVTVEDINAKQEEVYSTEQKAMVI